MSTENNSEQEKRVKKFQDWAKENIPERKSSFAAMSDTAAPEGGEQEVFEDWLARACPSGDHEAVQRQWHESSDYREWINRPSGNPGRHERCGNCGKMVREWVQPDWARDRLCLECESDLEPSQPPTGQETGTPRTDEASGWIDCIDGSFRTSRQYSPCGREFPIRVFVKSEFARTLERELTSAREEIARQQETIRKMEDTLGFIANGEKPKTKAGGAVSSYATREEMMSMAALALADEKET